MSSFDPSTGRYRDDAGKLISQTRIRAGLETVLDSQVAVARAVTERLVAGEVSLAFWQTQMMRVVADSQLVGVALANGGWSQLGLSEFGWAGQRIRAQYRYLNNFAAQIASGAQPLNGTAIARAGMYAEAGRATHRAAVARLAASEGVEQERNVLGAAEQHCGQCPGESMRGWVPIGSLTPVGSRTCLSHCRCHIEYRMKPVALAAA